MTNIEALDLLLKLYATADTALIAIKGGDYPPPEALAAFCRIVVSTTQALLVKSMDDDNVSQWEVEQRYKAVLAEMRQVYAEAAEAAAAETKH